MYVSCFTINCLLKYNTVLTDVHSLRYTRWEFTMMQSGKQEKWSAFRAKIEDPSPDPYHPSKKPRGEDTTLISALGRPRQGDISLRLPGLPVQTNRDLSSRFRERPLLTIRMESDCRRHLISEPMPLVLTCIHTCLHMNAHTYNIQ